MKFLRNNFAYILLGLIAVVLIFVTISLQVAILSTGETQNNRGFLYTLRQQLAALIQPPTDTPVTTTSATVGQPTATVVVIQTNTPNVIIVQPSPLPATPTTAPRLPTAPPAVVTGATGTAIQVPGISNASALATRLAAPTATSADGSPAATPVPTATLAQPLLDTPTPAPVMTTPPTDADFRLGYVVDNADCVAVTDVMKVVLAREFNLRIATVPFPDAAALFAKLATKTAAERVDLSFCYLDPSDRAYLQQYFGFMIFIGSGYRQLDNQKYMIMSNAAVKSPIERGNPCLYRFLTNLNLTDVDLGSGDAETWYQTHTDLVATWTRCE